MAAARRERKARGSVAGRGRNGGCDPSNAYRPDTGEGRSGGRSPPVADRYVSAGRHHDGSHCPPAYALRAEVAEELEFSARRHSATIAIHRGGGATLDRARRDDRARCCAVREGCQPIRQLAGRTGHTRNSSPNHAPSRGTNKSARTPLCIHSTATAKSARGRRGSKQPPIQTRRGVVAHASEGAIKQHRLRGRCSASGCSDPAEFP